MTYHMEKNNPRKKQHRPSGFELEEEFKVAFPKKLFEATTADLLFHWNTDGSAFSVNEAEYESSVLLTHPYLVLIPSFLNFRRQMRQYAFSWSLDHKTGTFTFSHEYFRRGQEKLLDYIVTRRKSYQSVRPCHSLRPTESEEFDEICRRSRMISKSMGSSDGSSPRRSNPSRTMLSPYTTKGSTTRTRNKKRQTAESDTLDDPSDKQKFQRFLRSPSDATNHIDEAKYGEFGLPTLELAKSATTQCPFDCSHCSCHKKCPSVPEWVWGLLLDYKTPYCELLTMAESLHRAFAAHAQSPQPAKKLHFYSADDNELDGFCLDGLQKPEYKDDVHLDQDGLCARRLAFEYL